MNDAKKNKITMLHLYVCNYIFLYIFECYKSLNQNHNTNFHYFGVQMR